MHKEGQDAALKECVEVGDSIEAYFFVFIRPGLGGGIGQMVLTLCFHLDGGCRGSFGRSSLLHLTYVHIVYKSHIC